MKKLIFTLAILGCSVAQAIPFSITIGDLKSVRYDFYSSSKKPEQAGTEFIVPRRLVAKGSFYAGTNGPLDAEQILGGVTLAKMMTNPEPSCALIRTDSTMTPVPANMRLMVSEVSTSTLNFDGMLVDMLDISFVNAPHYRKMNLLLKCANADLDFRLDTILGTVDDVLALDPAPAYGPAKMCILGWAPLG